MTNFNKKDKLEAVIFTFGKKTRENDGKTKKIVAKGQTGGLSDQRDIQQVNCQWQGT